LLLLSTTKTDYFVIAALHPTVLADAEVLCKHIMERSSPDTVNAICTGGYQWFLLLLVIC